MKTLILVLLGMWLAGVLTYSWLFIMEWWKGEPPPREALLAILLWPAAILFWVIAAKAGWVKLNL